MSRTIAALTLMLGLVAVSAATYSTAAPVRFIPSTESCPDKCICVTPNNEDELMEVVCPTESNVIDGGSPPTDVGPDDVVDVEAFIAATSKAETSEENFKKDDVPEPSATPEVSAAPQASPSPSPTPTAEQPTEVPLVFPADKTENSEEVIPRKVEIIDEENFTLHPDEEMLADQPADDDYLDSTGPPTLEVEPSAAEETKPSPTAMPAAVEEEKMILPSEEESDEEKSVEEEVIVPSAAAEVTATLKPQLLPAASASTPEPEKFSLPPDVDEIKSNDESEEPVEEKQATPSAAPTELPLVFNELIPASSAAPELEKKAVIEFVESIEDVLKPDEPTESSSTQMPALKALVDVDTNQLDESLTSEDLVLASDPEMSGKMLSEDEAPGVTEAPQQSTASWVILGLILAMFVGVLLYAAIKGRMETGGQDLMPKLPSISSAVATTGEYTKNRRPSNEGTEMKEMSKALLGSPLEDRISRYIDEEDEEQIKRLIQQEADEILEQVVVEPHDGRPVNNALEKPPRKFINVPPPIVPGRDGSIPNTPTLVRAKVVDMSPEVHHVGNGSATTTSLQ
jgi:hypothetical protein